MKILSIFLSLLIVCVGGFAVVAQTGEAVLARIGEQTLTVKDLDPQIAQAVENLPAEIAGLRQAELGKEINRLLFETEAAAKKTAVEKLFETQVKARVANPTAEQVQAVYAANRDRLGDATEERAKQIIVNYLRRENEAKIAAEFAEKLRAQHPVALVKDVSAPDLKPLDVLAIVGGKQLLARDFNERMKPLEYDLRWNVYNAQRGSLNQAIYSNLVLTEAKALSIQPEELIEREIIRKAGAAGGGDEQVRLQIALFEKLQAKYNVKILLAEPAAPILNVSADDDPARGAAAANAPVTIVMFTDFECPVCARVHPVIKSVLQDYAGKVRFVVRDFPLTEIHENAFRAAEAANAAHAQNKFFEYVELLYQNQKALDDASLKKYAAQIGLNPKQFETDLTSGKFAAEIRRDMRDGENYGVKGTPTVYVNGVRVNELSAEALKSKIEKALSKK